MNSQVVLFNGGINNIIEPHLIQDNECLNATNCCIRSGSLASARTPIEDTSQAYVGVNATYYKAQGEVVASNEDRFYVEWAGYLYWTNSAGKLKRYDGTTVDDIGSHTAPTSAPTTASNTTGLLNGDYIYLITYLHDDVFETAPSPIATSVTLANEKCLITYTDTPPATATHRLIYRAGGYNPTFNLVARTPKADTTYLDNTADFNISRQEVTTTDNEAPPENIDMLVELQGTLFASLGDKVYFSRSGQPEYWNAYNFLQLPTTVTGLGISGNTVIAFTDENMYMIQGTDIRNISISKLPFTFGCKDKRTVKSLKGRLIWLSSADEYDLLCSYDGSQVEILNRTNIELIDNVIIGSSEYDDYTDEDYGDFGYEINNAVTSGRKYYLFMSGRTIVVDFEMGVKIYYMAEDVKGAYIVSNQLYTIENSKIWDYIQPTTSYRDLNYFTKKYTNGEYTRDKTYRKIHVKGSGTWEIVVMVDDVEVYTFDNTQGSKVHLPAGIYGKSIYFDISSTGYAKINEISYEFEHKRLL